MFLAISFVPTLILLKQSASVVLDSGHFGLYQAVQSAALYQMPAAFFIPGVIFLLAGSRISRLTQEVCFVVGVFYAILFLFMGVRAAAVMNTVALAWTWRRTVRRIPRSVIIGSALVSLILFTLVQETRNMAGRNRTLTSTYTAMSNLENPISSAVAEMGVPYLLVVVLTKVRGRRLTAVTFTFAGGAIPVVQQGQFQRTRRSPASDQERAKLCSSSVFGDLIT